MAPPQKSLGATSATFLGRRDEVIASWASITKNSSTEAAYTRERPIEPQYTATSHEYNMSMHREDT